MCFDGKYVTVDKDIANHMNMYFCEIGEKLQDAIPDIGYDSKRYLPARVENTFFLSPTTLMKYWMKLRNWTPENLVGPIISEREWLNSALQYSPKTRVLYITKQ